MANQSGITLITGCSSGIGRALALEFHKRGQQVCATARKAETLKDLADAGMMTAELDVTNSASIDNLISRFQSEEIVVHTLINNAGYGAMGALTDIPLDEVKRLFEVNVFSVFDLCRRFSKEMIKQRSGMIINISSISGVTPTPFSGAYCASKAAVTAMSDVLRMELDPFGIKVMIVQPGGIASNFGNRAEQDTTIAEDSPYNPIRDAILARAQGSQENATPAEEFAAILADAALKETPPALIRIGTRSFMLPFLKRWLPVNTLDRMFKKKFKLTELEKH